MSKQVSALRVSANPSSGSAEAKTQFSCIQVKHCSWVRYTFQNLAKNILKNRYFSRKLYIITLCTLIQKSRKTGLKSLKKTSQEKTLLNIPENGRRTVPALLQLRLFSRDWLPAGPEVMKGR